MVNKICNKTVTAVILMAGNSSRFNSIKNKTFEILGDKEIIILSLIEFNKNSRINDIIIAVRDKDKKELETIIKKYDFNKKITLVNGGNTRSESVYNCIKNVTSEIVIIHDGARPFIKQEYINKCIDSMLYYDGVSIGIKTKDTIKLTDNNDIVVSTTVRNNTWIVQTPQCFNYKKLITVYNNLINKKLNLGLNITDDCVLMEQSNYNIKMIEGDSSNIKITTQEDMIYAKYFYDYLCRHKI